MASHERGYPTLLQVTRQPTGALVLAKRAIAGDLWFPGDTRSELARAVISGSRRNILTAQPQPSDPQTAARYHRQSLLFGGTGQAILASTKVAVIGAGGIGMLLVQLLARLGVGHLVVIDPERVDPTNLPRLPEILHARPPLPELAVLEQLVAVKDPEIIDRLEQALDEALGSPDGKRLGLSWPHERIDENGTPTSFRVYGLGRQAAAPQDGLPVLETFLEPLADVAAGERVERLKKIKVMLYRDADATDSMSFLIPGLRWIAFETDADSRRYCLHDGHWYLMNQQYAERLRRQAQQIFDRGPGLALPDWPAGQHEEEYNKLAAHAVGGLCLDRTPMTSDLHRHGIEVCDVLTPDGALIHVKDLSSSAPASHLLAQALVSADALLFGQSAQQQFRKKIADCGWDPVQLPAKPQKVVLGVARKGKEVTAESLFTFTQVTLVRQHQALAARGVEVVVAPITREG